MTQTNKLDEILSLAIDQNKEEFCANVEQLLSQKAVLALSSTEEEVTESADQLDELSKDTLKSYIKKAAPNIATKASKFTKNPESNSSGKNSFNSVVNRIDGVRKAVDKLAK